ncbi:MAG: aromatic ring-hydroxylating dioxygenase subunit alpha [Halioglobus sp.]|nr:aromatic ring-hydroxylating dioxygenase subunit alpha [Halioglobus sp.]
MDKIKHGSARYKGPSYQDLLNWETRPVPPALRATTDTYLGSEPLSTDCYLTREQHEREKENLWPCVWQSLCRETEISEPGAFFVHDIGATSVLVVRTKDNAIKAFPNACLHRGRQLKSGGDSGLGNSVDITCPFHGFRWNLEGHFEGAPCQWDFAHLDEKNFDLPALRLDTWGGWVFVNIDGKAPPLREYLGVVVDHFQRWAPEKTYKSLHIKKVIRCNWKLAHEAFIESYHTVATHPQLLPYTGDSNSQYDCFSNIVSRTITPMGVVSPHASGTTEEQSVHQWLTVYGMAAGGELSELPAGMSAREYLGEMNIQRFSEMYQQDLSPFATHSEVLDAILYSVFPNFAPWAGYRPNVTYRFLPYNDSHEMCTMEIMLMMRFPESEARPPDASVQFVPADQTLAETPGIEAGLAAVFDQDFSNLPMVHKGLHSLQSGQIELANYQEVRIRHFHQVLDKYLNAGEGEER